MAVRVFALCLTLAVAVCHLPAVQASNGGEVMQLNDANFHQQINDHDVVIVNFYADWCRFCQMLKPIFAAAAQKVGDHPRILFARVDCEAKDTETSKTENHISKYPTLKVYRHGHPLKSEYRGQRSPEALNAYVLDLVKEAIIEVDNVGQVDRNLERLKRGVVGMFDSREAANYVNFKTVGTEMRDNCHFIGLFSKNLVERTFYKEHGEETEFKGDPANIDELRLWAKEICSPLVREITFENGEELTEEGLPFLIMFYDPAKLESVKLFKHVVRARFEKERESINFIIADGVKFAHPLKHLGKSRSDLPVLAFDTFRHMYLYKRFKSIAKPGNLEKFIADLHAGKLHQNFHNPVPNAIEPVEEDLDFDPYSDEYLEDDGRKPSLADKLDDAEDDKEDMEEAHAMHKEQEAEDRKEMARRKAEQPHIDHEVEGDDPSRPVPVKSVLKKLKPSENRYSFRKEEL